MPRRLQPIIDQTFDQLEHIELPAPKQDTYVTSNVHRLRQVPLNQYRIKDLRLMISQQIGTQFLVPLALDHLELHPFAEGDFYPGDLLLAVIELHSAFWQAHSHLIPKALRAIDAASARMGKIATIDDFQDRLRSSRDRLRDSVP